MMVQPLIAGTVISAVTVNSAVAIAVMLIVFAMGCFG